MVLIMGPWDNHVLVNRIEIGHKIKQRAMYKTKNAETGNRMWGTQRMGVCYIPGNVVKHFGKCFQIFWGMSPSITGNVLKHSG